MWRSLSNSWEIMFIHKSCEIRDFGEEGLGIALRFLAVNTCPD